LTDNELVEKLIANIIFDRYESRWFNAFWL